MDLCEDQGIIAHVSGLFLFSVSAFIDKQRFVLNGAVHKSLLVVY